MLKFVTILISLFLIIIIFLRMPDEIVGLASFANKSNLLGSPSAARRFLNILTGLGIIVYFGLAIQLNLLSS